MSDIAREAASESLTSYHSPRSRTYTRDPTICTMVSQSLRCRVVPDMVSQCLSWHGEATNFRPLRFRIMPFFYQKTDDA